MFTQLLQMDFKEFTKTFFSKGVDWKGGGGISLRNLVMFRQQQQQQQHTDFKEFTAFFPFPLFKSSPFSLIICLTGAWEHIIVSPSAKDLVLNLAPQYKSLRYLHQ